jgi:hypothetical protein
MKSKTKLWTSIITIMLTLVLLFVIIPTNFVKANTEQLSSKERTVELTHKFLDDNNITTEFDEYDYNEDENGFEIQAKKSFDKSIFSELDLVGLDEDNEQFTAHYSVQYIEDDSTILLSVTLENADEESIIDTLPGLLTYNSSGEPDVMFVADGELIWLSELQEIGILDEVNWFSTLAQKVVNKALEITAAVVTAICAPAFRAVSYITVKLGGQGALDFGAALLNMSRDEAGIYHAAFDCWQAAFGYNNLYDVVFKVATTMDRRQYPFDVDGDRKADYILWAWKGDYWELGIGAELGVYKKWPYWEDVWTVDKSQAMKMTLQVDYKENNNYKTIIDWQPTDKQWWITGFNPNYANKNIKADEIKVTYKVTFNNNKMLEAFKSSRTIYEDLKWNYNDRIATLIF